MENRSMLSLFTLIKLVYLSNAVYSFPLDSKLDLPGPSALVSGRDTAQLDSSLSPKVIKAFYEINFIPVSDKPLDSKVGFVSLPASGKNCPYDSKQLCKYLYFVPSKVSTVQKVEDFIRESKENGDVPVVTGVNGITNINIGDLFEELNRTINDQVNKKVPTTTTTVTNDVPIYKGVVHTDEILNRPERPEFYPIGGLYPPPKPYYPPSHSRPSYPWSDGQPHPCFQSPCTTPSWKSPITIKLQ